MSESEKQIEERLRQGFLGQLILSAQIQSSNAQVDFLKQVKGVATLVNNLIREHLLVKSVAQKANEFWETQRGARLQFTDGGVANINIPSAAPLGIRVGNYSVCLGDTTPARETFEFSTHLVDELFSDSPQIYDDHFQDTDKLRDAARIIAEIAAVFIGLTKSEDTMGAFIHGPLVNPVSPYGLTDFPAFQPAVVHQFVGPNVSDEFCDFIPLYKYILEQLQKQSAFIVGVVERSKGAAPGILTRAVLATIVDLEGMSRKAERKLLKRCEEYRITDVLLFGAVLSEGEYIVSDAVSKQGPNSKWPVDWAREIEAFPRPDVGYIKTSEHQEPTRFEIFSNGHDRQLVARYVYFMSKLLPEYSFPVGLDIVDKFAKVPSWMTGQVRKEHAIALLKHALASGDKAQIELAKRVLVTKGRDWLFRPKA